MDIPVNFYFELLNVFFTALFLIVLRRRFDLDDVSFLLLIVHFLLIFVTNYVLFPPSYMGDQFLYLFGAQNFRGLDTPVLNSSSRIMAASAIFAFFPMPVINSIYSLGCINFIMYAVLFVFFKSRGVLSGSNRFFYLLYPSLALYTTLALRDGLIFFLMALFIYFVFVRKMVFRPMLFFGLPLFLLKYQNAFVIFIVLAVFILLHKDFHPLIKVTTVAVIAASFFLFGSMLTIDNLNKIRLLFHLENNSTLLGFKPFSSWLDAGAYGFSSFFSFLMEPMPWSFKNSFQFIQSLENIAVLFILLKLLLTQRRSAFRVEKFCLILFFIIGLLIYAIVIINAGTAARYRYPFLAIFYIFYYHYKTLPEAKGEEGAPTVRSRRRLLPSFSVKRNPA